MKMSGMTLAQKEQLQRKFELIGKKLDVHRNGVIYLEEVDSLLNQIDAKLCTPLSQFFRAYATQSKHQTISVSLLTSNLVKAWNLNKFGLRGVFTEKEQKSGEREENFPREPTHPPLKVLIEQQRCKLKEKKNQHREISRKVTPCYSKVKCLQLPHYKQIRTPRGIASKGFFCTTALKISEGQTNLLKHDSDTSSHIVSKTPPLSTNTVKKEKTLSKDATKKEPKCVKKAEKDCLSSSQVGVMYPESISVINKIGSKKTINSSAKDEYGFEESQLSYEHPKIIHAASEEKIKVPTSRETPRKIKTVKLSQYCRPRTEVGRKQLGRDQKWSFKKSDPPGPGPVSVPPEQQSPESSLTDFCLVATSSLPNNLGNYNESETSLFSEFDGIKDWILNDPRTESAETKKFPRGKKKCFFDVQSPFQLNQLLKHGYAYKDREKKIYHEQKQCSKPTKEKTSNLLEDDREMEWARRPSENFPKSKQADYRCFPKTRRSDNLPTTIILP